VRRLAPGHGKDGCGSVLIRLTLIIAASWLTLARHQEAMDELLAIGAKLSPRCQSSCLSNFPAIRAAVRLLVSTAGSSFRLMRIGSACQGDGKRRGGGAAVFRCLARNERQPTHEGHLAADHRVGAEGDLALEGA
jgi:hypothetical protein